MKRIFLITILIMGLIVAHSFAQMGGGMMGGQKGRMGGGMMGGQQGQMMEHKSMMSHGEMMSNMMDMTNQMSGMMKDMPKEHMRKMSAMMRDMSKEMVEMSKIMEGGMASEKEMKKMHDRMIEMRNRISDMMKK